jgi:hypothetical protein
MSEQSKFIKEDLKQPLARRRVRCVDRALEACNVVVAEFLGCVAE